jgi:hypothetical protein
MATAYPKRRRKLLCSCNVYELIKRHAVRIRQLPCFLLEVKVEAVAQVAFRITDPLNGWASSSF